MTKHCDTRGLPLTSLDKAQSQLMQEIFKPVAPPPAWLFSEKKPTSTLGGRSYTLPERFTLDTIGQDPNKINTSVYFCYDGKAIASVSWHHQNRVSAFLIHLGYIVVYESLDEAIDKLVMHTIQLRLHGVI